MGEDDQCDSRKVISRVQGISYGGLGLGENKKSSKKCRCSSTCAATGGRDEFLKMYSLNLSWEEVLQINLRMVIRKILGFRCH